MMLWENLKMALTSLKNAKLRSFLTMLGIIIGVSAVVSILAIGDGVKLAIQSQITSVVNADSIDISSGSMGSGKAGGAGAASSLGASTLTSKDVTALQKLPHISAVAPMGLVSGIISYESQTDSQALLIATVPSFAQTQTLTYSGGRFLQNSDANQNVVVLGGQAKQALFGNASAIGKTVMIRDIKFEVVGTLQTSDSSATSLTGSSLDNSAFIPLSTSTTFSGGAPQILRILVQADSNANVKTVAAEAKSALDVTHGGQNDFSVLTQQDILSTVDNVLSLLTTFIVAIASISLLVGGIGIMNIMLVSVTERTREIGLRKAIGASFSIIMVQFLIEAVVLSLIGGVLGIAAAIGEASIAGKLAKITPDFTPGSIALAVGVSAFVGILFGIAPAIKAARKRPIQALKAE